MSKIIKGVRNLRGYTQEEVAKALGIAPKTYRGKEANPDTFTVSEIKKLARFLELEEGDFFKTKFALTVS